VAEPPRRRPGSGEQPKPRVTQELISPDTTSRNEKITPAAGTVLPDTRAVSSGRAAKIIDDLIGDGEPTRTAMPTETVPYAKAKFLNPNDPLLKTTLDARAAQPPSPAQMAAMQRRMPAATERDLPAVMPSMESGRERLLTPLPPQPLAPPSSVTPSMSTPIVERERVTTPMPVQSSAQTQQLAPAATPAPADTVKTKVWVATHKLPADPDARLILLREPDGPRAASFRVLRHRLQERNDPRTIVVSSPDAGDGKTTCAVNLALALGECGRARVLLLEANLRAPSLAALFGFLPPECFSAQLERHRERPLDPWSVVEVGAPWLHVAAVKPGASTEGRPLLDGVAFGIAIDMLKRGGYDYLVLDTPPVLGSADVNLVEDFADGVLLMAWSRKSSSRALRRAIDQLQPGKILGVTLLDA